MEREKYSQTNGFLTSRPVGKGSGDENRKEEDEGVKTQKIAFDEGKVTRAKYHKYISKMDPKIFIPEEETIEGYDELTPLDKKQLRSN